MTDARRGELLDDDLVEVFLSPVRLSAAYKPAFGKGKLGGVDYEAFQTLYGGDAFYSWLGLHDPVMYAAHKAAGGLTSVYRQIGVGSERLLRRILAERFRLSNEQLAWSYTYTRDDGMPAELALDARISLMDLEAESKRRLGAWLATTYSTMPKPSSGAIDPEGIVMEIRQGYKSADSKRQNADVRYGMRAYQAKLLPTVVVMSNQVSEPVLRRYRADGILVLTGDLDGSSAHSTFSFFKEVVDYDLAGFFERNTGRIAQEVTAVVQALLTP